MNDFLSWHDRKELVLQPRFQRRDVWPTKAKSHLIDTILRELPVPIIFIRQDIDPRQRRTIREVVDGQQRLRSVISFAKDEFPVLKSQNPSFGGLTFGQLPSAIQHQFLNYEFSVVLLEGAGDAVVLDIFARLNTFAQKLTEQELLNASFFGQFKQTVFSLGYEHLAFWRNNGILKDRQIVRMAEAELVTELMVVMLLGVQRRREKIRELYESKDDVFPERVRVEKEFKAIIDAMEKSFDGNLKGTVYSKRVLFSSLFCAFYHTRFGIPQTPELGKGGKVSSFSAAALAKIKESLLNLETLYKRTPPPQNLRKFVEACQKATADREERLTRVGTLYDCITRGLDSH